MKPAFFLAATAALAVLSSCAKPAPPMPGAAPNLPPVKVRLAIVRTEDVPAVTDVTGTVHPVQRATIAAKLMGVIEEMPVMLGQRVRTGDVLAKINAGEITARVAQAQSQLNQVQRDLARERDLLAKNASTSDMVKGLEDRLAMTQAMVREAEVMVGYMTVRAPFDGVVARKPAHAGDLAAPGQALLELEGLGEFQIEAGIPDSAAARLVIGATLAVEVPAAGVAFSARLVELSPESDAHARTAVAKLSIPAGTTVRSGQFARVQVPGVAVRTLLAPVAAVSTLGQMERVFVAGEGNRAVLRLV
ncbi:MAG: efflux RND transporter periplasmic adaptor subunit, partial [Verrucomicrobia bacterium]|nr:efflux RND transporter periplasmic adaptor subunit [Verrucomicrobiota bacterium]